MVCSIKRGSKYNFQGTLVPSAEGWSISLSFLVCGIEIFVFFSRPSNFSPRIYGSVFYFAAKVIDISCIPENSFFFSHTQLLCVCSEPTVKKLEHNLFFIYGVLSAQRKQIIKKVTRKRKCRVFFISLIYFWNKSARKCGNTLKDKHFWQQKKSEWLSWLKVFCLKEKVSCISSCES